jgi:hypothetical protein
MKTRGDKIREYITIGLLCGTLVTAGWALREIIVVKEGVKALQNFQDKQIEINARESIVYNWALQKLRKYCL